MANYSKEFLEKTCKFWQPYSKEPLLIEDAREIAVNAVNLFKFLRELDTKYGANSFEKEPI